MTWDWASFAFGAVAGAGLGTAIVWWVLTRIRFYEE
jgi:hypothetical protein